MFAGHWCHSSSWLSTCWWFRTPKQTKGMSHPWKSWDIYTYLPSQLYESFTLEIMRYRRISEPSTVGWWFFLLIRPKDSAETSPSWSFEFLHNGWRFVWCDFCWGAIPTKKGFHQVFIYPNWFRISFIKKSISIFKWSERTRMSNPSPATSRIFLDFLATGYWWKKSSVGYTPQQTNMAGGNITIANRQIHLQLVVFPLLC